LPAPLGFSKGDPGPTDSGADLQLALTSAAEEAKRDRC
jgi:hypothetical protein